MRDLGAARRRRASLLRSVVSASGQQLTRRSPRGRTSHAAYDLMMLLTPAQTCSVSRGSGARGSQRTGATAGRRSTPLRSAASPFRAVRVTNGRPAGLAAVDLAARRSISVR